MDTGPSLALTGFVSTPLEVLIYSDIIYLYFMTGTSTTCNNSSVNITVTPVDPQQTTTPATPTVSSPTANERLLIALTNKTGALPSTGLLDESFINCNTLSSSHRYYIYVNSIRACPASCNVSVADSYCTDISAIRDRYVLNSTELEALLPFIQNNCTSNLTFYGPVDCGELAWQDYILVPALMASGFAVFFLLVGFYRVKFASYTKVPPTVSGPYTNEAFKGSVDKFPTIETRPENDYMIYNKQTMRLDSLDIVPEQRNGSYVMTPSDDEFEDPNVLSAKDISFSGSMERFGLQDTSFRLSGKEMGVRSDWDKRSNASSGEHIYDVPSDARFSIDSTVHDSEL
jgi:hypothetical protein